MRALLADRRVRLLLVGQSLSMFGDSVLILALAIWVKDITDSSAAAGVVILLIVLPALAAPFAGYVVDRVPRRRLLVSANAASIFVVLPLLAVHGRDRLLVIDAVAFAYGVSFVVIQPTTSALVHALVATEDLPRANGFLQTVNEGLRLAGPLIGAAVYAAFGGGAVAIIDAATFAVAALFVARIPGDDPRPPTMINRLRAELSAGVRHLWRTDVLRIVVGVAGVAVLVIGFSETVFFAVVDEGLHRPPSFLGVLSSIQGAGAILGGLTAAQIIRRRGEPDVLALGLLALGLGCALSAASSLLVVAAGTVLFGLGIPWAVVAMNTVIQRNTPSHLQGRAMSASSMVLSAPQTLSIGFGALAIAIVDYRLLLAAMTAVLVSCAAYLLTRTGQRTRTASPSTEI
jgi:MFS family permease